MEQKTFLHLTPGEWALVGVTVIWGTTFLIIRNAMQYGGPLFFVGLRFACAALAMVLVSLPVLRGLTLRELGAGFCIGTGLFIGYALQTFGLQWITASKSAFITAFYVPAVPLAQWCIMRRRPNLPAWAGIMLAFAGVALLAGPDGVSLGFGKGELFTFISALAVGVEIVLIGFFAGTVDVRRVTIVQVAVCSLLAFGCMPIAGEAVPPLSWVFALSACGLGVATALIQAVMNWAQRSITPTRATVIYAGEPIWAGIFGRIAGERLPAAAVAGAALIVLGVLVSGAKPRKKPKQP